MTDDLRNAIAQARFERWLDPDPLEPTDIDRAYAVGFADAWDSPRAVERRPGLLALLLVAVTGAIVGALITAAAIHAAPRPAQTTTPLPSASELGDRQAHVVLPPTAAGAPRAQASTSAGPTPAPLAAYARGRTGVIAYATIGGPGYLAVPIGPGHRVRICGPAACWTTVSTDAGPNHERLVAGRIADVAVGQWERICGLDRTRGTCVGSWVVVGPGPTPPATDVQP